MGFKRPFDGEEFQGLTYKQSRVPCGDKCSRFIESVPCTAARKSELLFDGSYDKSVEKFEGHDHFGNKSVPQIPNLAQGIDANLSLPVISSSYSDDEPWFASEYPVFPEFFGHDLPRRMDAPSEDVCVSYMDHYPRKQIPVGPDHQAVLPSNGDEDGLEHSSSYVPNVHSVSGLVRDSRDKEKDLIGSCIISMPDRGSDVDKEVGIGRKDKEKDLIGSCIISMPDRGSDVDREVGIRRKDCNCPDAHSIRCVRQHVMEAREKLRRYIGHEKFVDLGFYEMGEEVACQWSEEEERVFHGVIYSNPASLGHNFWRHLSEVFPTRSTMEIVSYYFNVFMLRKRASQNRSNLLDIDSDDDEWHGINRNSYRVSKEEEDSGVESPLNQSDDVEQVGDIMTEDEDDDNSDDSDGDQGDLGDGSGDATGEDSGVDYGIEGFDTTSFNGSRLDPSSIIVDSKTGSPGADFASQEDSCISFEFQPDDVDAGNTYQGCVHGNVPGKCFPSVSDGCSNGDGQVLLLDPCDSRLWDVRFGSSMMGVDLLPTCNIIEEIFGQGTCDDQTRNGHGIS